MDGTTMENSSISSAQELAIKLILEPKHLHRRECVAELHNSGDHSKRQARSRIVVGMPREAGLSASVLSDEVNVLAAIEVVGIQPELLQHPAKDELQWWATDVIIKQLPHTSACSDHRGSALLLRTEMTSSLCEMVLVISVVIWIAKRSQEANASRATLSWVRIVVLQHCKYCFASITLPHTE